MYYGPNKGRTITDRTVTPKNRIEGGAKRWSWNQVKSILILFASAPIRPQSLGVLFTVDGSFFFKRKPQLTDIIIIHHEDLLFRKKKATFSTLKVDKEAPWWDVGFPSVGIDRLAQARLVISVPSVPLRSHPTTPCALLATLNDISGLSNVLPLPANFCTSPNLVQLLLAIGRIGGRNLLRPIEAKILKLRRDYITIFCAGAWFELTTL